MKIKIKDIEVETKEIISIEKYRRERFWSRQIGVKIELHKKEDLIIEWAIAYETTNGEHRVINENFERFLKELIAEWEKDKVIYPTEPEMPSFNFIV